MSIIKKKEIGIGVFFLIVSALYLFGTKTIVAFSPFGNRGLDSKSIPQVVGGLMFVLSIIQICTALLKKDIKKDEKEKSCLKIVIDADNPIFKLVISICLLVLYVFLFTRLGFILSSTLYLFPAMLILIPSNEKKKWVKFLFIFSLLIPVIISFIFTKYLSLFLPRGILGF